MGKGGRRYPIEHADGRELDFANLLWEALFSHKSQQGAQFRSELDDIYLRSRSLALLSKYHHYPIAPCVIDNSLKSFKNRDQFV